MNLPTPKNPTRLSREITAALLLKIVLLWGLWHFAIRPSKPPVKPDIAELFRPAPPQTLNGDS